MSQATITIPSLIPATDFYLASGTITLDPKQHKVLIILDRAAGTYKLPRGRKDWGEHLEATAVRETLEETGAHCTLLPVPLSTRATCPTTASDPNHAFHAAAQTARFSSDGDVLLPGSARVVEPVAVMQHRQANGALAVVLWYVAVADSSAPLAAGTQMADEDYEALWVGYDEGARVMVNGDYAELVRRAVALVSAIETEGGATRKSSRLVFDGLAAAGPDYSGTENLALA